MAGPINASESVIAWSYQGVAAGKSNLLTRPETIEDALHFRKDWLPRYANPAINTSIGASVLVRSEPLS